jgi:RNA polymerase sigma-70 factor (ECF subfamily)
MSVEHLDRLLERLNNGDLDAAEQVVLAYEPYLRMVARHSLPDRLRAQFDSGDVVQSVWVHLLHGLRRAAWEFPDRPHLLALLVTITRRRMANRFRHHRTALEREQPNEVVLDVQTERREPEPPDAAQAEELWQHLLELCPATHRELLHFKRQGLSLGEIASRTGLHEGSVRRILRRLARQLALENQLQIAATGA